MTAPAGSGSTIDALREINDPVSHWAGRCAERGSAALDLRPLPGDSSGRKTRGIDSRGRVLKRINEREFGSRTARISTRRTTRAEGGGYGNSRLGGESFVSPPPQDSTLSPMSFPPAPLVMLDQSARRRSFGYVTQRGPANPL